MNNEYVMSVGIVCKGKIVIRICDSRETMSAEAGEVLAEMIMNTVKTMKSHPCCQVKESGK